MPNPTTQLLNNGRLDDAIAALKDALRRNPNDLASRSDLVTLLCCTGQLEQAERILGAFDVKDRAIAAEAREYRALLNAVQHRNAIARDGALPDFVAPPNESMKLRLRAQTEVSAGDISAAVATIAEADEIRLPLPGRADGTPFDDFYDFDDIHRDSFEVLQLTGTCAWVPMHLVATISFDPQAALRDYFWRVSTLELQNGFSVVGFVPVTYEGSEFSKDVDLRLGRAIEWSGDEAGPTRGIGQHLYLCGGRNLPLMRIGQLEFGSGTVAVGA